MILQRCVTVLIACLFVFAANADERPQYQVKVTVTLDDGQGVRRMELDSTNLGIAVQDMELGEVQTVLGSDGNEIYVTRNDDGIAFDVGGDIIEMPAFEYSEEVGAWLDSESNPLDIDGDSDETYLAENADPAAEENSVTIISGREIDEETKKVIRTALATAGQENVRFVGGNYSGSH